ETVRPITTHRRNEGMAVVHRHDGAWPFGVDALESTITDICDLTCRILGGSPPEARPAAGAAGPFPLRLGGQVVGQPFLLGALRQPAAERLAVAVADVDDGVIVTQGERAGVTRLPPVDAGPVFPLGFRVVSVAAAVLLAIGDVRGRLDELAELPYRHLVFAQV